MKALTILFLLVGISFADDNQEISRLTQLITESIQNTTTYELPTDNSEMSETINNSIRDFGNYDFIIIGAGAAGAALAYELASVQKLNILLLEAGGNETEFSEIPAMVPYLMKSDMNWGYYTTAQSTCCLGMKNNKCFYPRGKAMGGTTAVNALIYTRGNKFDYDLWKKMGNAGWSYKDVLPVFRRQETSYVNSDKGFHGNNGPLITNYTFGDSTMVPLYLKASNEMGNNNIDINGKSQFGSSKIPVNIDKNKRLSSNKAFIKNIRGTNLKISQRSFVTKIMIDKDSKTAYGVEFIKNKQKYHATINKEVILSAGSINSPQILMLSGIGPLDELTKHNIPCIKNLPVGKKLQEHPVFLGINIRTNLSQPELTLNDQVKNYVEFKKPLTTNFGCEVITFINASSSNKVNRPDIEILTALQTLNSEIGNFFFNWKSESENFIKTINASTDYALFLVLLHGKSRGKVTLNSNKPQDFPNTDLNLFSDKNNVDLDTFYDGLLYVKEMLQTDAFRSINATIMNPRGLCDELEDDSKDYWQCLFRKLSTTLWHPVGTARMGKSPCNSVVNNKLEVHGIQRLRVVDASIMPEITSAHTGAVSMMIGGKAGDIIKEKYAY